MRRTTQERPQRGVGEDEAVDLGPQAVRVESLEAGVDVGSIVLAQDKGKTDCVAGLDHALAGGAEGGDIEGRSQVEVDLDVQEPGVGRGLVGGGGDFHGDAPLWWCGL